MLNEIEKKYDLIRKKMLFYGELSKETGISESTIMGLWLNSNQGFKIPERHQQKTIEVLNHCLEYEQAEKRLAEKYFKK